MKKEMGIEDACLHISIECHSFHQRKKFSCPRLKPTRSGEPMCQNALRNARAKEFNHNVFEVAWLTEVGSLTKMRSRELQDVKRDALNVRYVAQQSTYGERDDVVFSGIPALAVSRTLLTLTVRDIL